MFYIYFFMVIISIYWVRYFFIEPNSGPELLASFLSCSTLYMFYFFILRIF